MKNAPKIPERPHLEVPDLEVLLLLGLHPVLARAAAAPRRGRVRLGLRRRRRRMPVQLVAVDLLLVLPRARRARPPVPPARLRRQRRVVAPHVEEAFAPVALHCFRSAKGASAGVVLRNVHLVSSEYARGTPLLACGASAEVVRQVRHDLLLRDHIFVPRHQNLADVVGDCEPKL